VPDDLLRFVSGTSPNSQWWLWLSLALIMLVIAWYAVVFVWTLPSAQLRRLPGIRAVHSHVLRRRFSRSIRKIVDDHHSGGLSVVDAGAQISRTLRSFLHQSTGTPAQYMHVDAIGESNLGAAGPVFSALSDVQFNTGSDVNVDDVAEAAEKLIRTWS
jgi:hypothetical protein